jgi:hypothetical protein
MLGQSFEENVLIRKQREEIVLLTNELKQQEIQLNSLFNENLKIKSSLKTSRKKSDEYEIKIKHLEAEISRLTEAERQNSDVFKAKLHNKECVLSKTCIKLKQVEFNNEKLNQEVENYLKTIKVNRSV